MGASASVPTQRKHFCVGGVFRGCLFLIHTVEGRGTLIRSKENILKEITKDDSLESYED